MSPYVTSSISAKHINYPRYYTLRDLKDHILLTKFTKDEPCLKVFTFEASAGKTQTVCEALKELYKIDPNIKTLIVTKLMDEQEKIQQSLGDIAFVVNSKEETIKKQEKKIDFNQYPVLIITHELYARLCSNEKRRQYYTQGRDLLIIDEQLDILDILEYSASRAEKITTALKSVISYKGDVDLCEYWGEITAPLNEAVKNNYGKKMRLVYVEDERIQYKIDYLLKLIKKSKFPAKTEFKKKNVIAEIQRISQFFNNHHVIATGGILYVYNKCVDYFLLNNNIMLDASGNFLHLYNISDKFKLYKADREILHTNTVLTFVNENSTTTAINKDEKKYYGAVIDYIRKHTTQTDKVLIIGRKKDEDYFKPLLHQNVQFINFSAMRGRNDWSDYNKCFIIHLPNDIFYKYPLQWLYYTGKQLKQSDLEINKIDTNHGFKNNIELEKLRITDVVSSIYQGLKRVNRINTAENPCELYVITNNKWIKDLVREQFLGLKEVREDKLFRKDTLTQERSQKLAEVFENMQPGEKIEKKDLRNIVGITDRKKFSITLKALGGKEYLEKLGIQEQGHFYVKL